MVTQVTGRPGRIDIFCSNACIAVDQSEHFFFFSSRRRHTRCSRDWSSDVCSSDLLPRAKVEVFSLAIDPGIESTLYAGTSGGLFMSVNGGEGWTPVKAEPNTQVVNTVAVDPTNHRTLYAGLKDGVFKSTDGGETWSTSKLSPQYLLTLEIDPTNARILYAGTYLSGLFQSTNGGEDRKSVV